MISLPNISIQVCIDSGALTLVGCDFKHRFPECILIFTGVEDVIVLKTHNLCIPLNHFLTFLYFHS